MGDDFGGHINVHIGNTADGGDVRLEQGDELFFISTHGESQLHFHLDAPVGDTDVFYRLGAHQVGAEIGVGIFLQRLLNLSAGNRVHCRSSLVDWRGRKAGAGWIRTPLFYTILARCAAGRRHERTALPQVPIRLAAPNMGKNYV